MAASAVGILALVGAAGAASQWIAWRIKLPSILLLLFAGILLGPVLGWLHPDELLGDILFPFISIAVAIILFEGGLTLNRDEIRGHGRVVRLLLTVGVALSWLAIAATVHYLFDVTWAIAFLFGSIGVVTGPTVIKPLLRIVRPSEKISQVLHWEGILVDPVGAMLAILVFEYIVETESGGGVIDVGLVLASLVTVGFAFGAAFGAALAWLLKNRHIPDFLVESTTLLSVVAAFAVSEHLQHEAGLVAVTIMGIWLANSKGVRLQEIVHFKENLTILLISGLFVLLAARLEIGAIMNLGISALLFLFIIQFLIRPISVLLCTIGSGWSWQERAMLAWIAPRGIVAAAISSLFLLRLEAVDITEAELLVPLAFVMIIGTVVFQSVSSKAVAEKLSVRNPDPNGVLIIGADSVARTLGKSLKEAGVKVILSDGSGRNVREARSIGLKTFHGHVTSAHAESHLDLTGIGSVIALSKSQDLNSLAALHFRNEFDVANIYIVNQATGSPANPEEVSADLAAYQFLFSREHSYQNLSHLFESGVHVSSLKIDEGNLEQLNTMSSSSQHDADSALALHAYEDGSSGAEEFPCNNLRLFAVDGVGKAYIYTADSSPTLEAGWQLLYLADASDD